jgi:hypothetical protein
VKAGNFVGQALRLPWAGIARLAILLCTTLPVPAADFFVSTNGASSANGSISLPWDLYTAFKSGAVKPGDTIWLRGGIYFPQNPAWQSLDCCLQGSPNAPIIVRAWPGERVILQEHPQYSGSDTPVILVQQSGGYVWFWGIEIRSPSTARYTSTKTSNPTYAQLRLPNSVDIEAPGDKLINVIVHDTRGGVGSFAGGVNVEIAGCLIYNNGWNAPDRGHGHGIYVQNATGVKHLSENIIFGQFGLGIHGYTPHTSLRHFLIERNVVFNNARLAAPPSSAKEQILFGGGPPIHDVSFFNNCVYLPLDQNSTVMRLDYAANSNIDVVLGGNYVAGGTGSGQFLSSAMKYQSVIFTNNTLYTTNGSLLGVSSATANQVNDNAYYGTGGSDFTYGPSTCTFANWKATTGYDSRSSYAAKTAPANHIVVNPNPYEPKRANIVVYNWGNSNTVSVDVSHVLTNGDLFEVRNAQDYFARPVLVGTYTGAPLVLPMTNLTTAAPNGWTGSVPTTGTGFNAFVLLSPTVIP